MRFTYSFAPSSTMDIVFVKNKGRTAYLINSLHMLQRFFCLFTLSCCLFVLASCAKEEDPLLTPISSDPEDPDLVTGLPGGIDLTDPLNYGSQPVPDYIDRDNTRANPITDVGATLGRVLFYDKALSSDRTISCASCHQQELAFGDANLASTGVAGTTGRHAMRLVNARFGEEVRFFWDERAATLEAQTTLPIQDHIEMGFSGANGDPDFSDLLTRLNGIDYYQEMFSAAFGTPQATEERLQLALAQFIRSMQSFDSRYDEGRLQVNNDNTPFPNYTDAENRGKQLFMGRPQFNDAGSRIGGGLGCNACHQAPEFSIDPRSRNNGVIGLLNG
ncbi:MAG: cytochrome-c peroxidase, partial [Bacteroidota bacterium]